MFPREHLCKTFLPARNENHTCLLRALKRHKDTEHILILNFFLASTRENL